MARPRSSLSFLVFDGQSQPTMERIIAFLESLAAKSPNFQATYNSESAAGYSFVMTLATYAFVVQSLVVLLFTTMACSLFGESKLVVTLKDDGERLYVDVVNKKPKTCGCWG